MIHWLVRWFDGVKQDKQAEVPAYISALTADVIGIIFPLPKKVSGEFIIVTRQLIIRPTRVKDILVSIRHMNRLVNSASDKLKCNHY